MSAIGLELQENVPLAPLTTLGIGGAARYFVSVRTEDELLEAVRFARAQGLPLFILGGGSNLLVSDAGFAGLVVHLGITADTLRAGNYSTVAAGTDWDAFVRVTCEKGISGVECLAGIPGLVGGSPIQNIGAYGQEVAQTIHSVTALDLESLQMVTLEHAACGFAYRTSIFNTTSRNRYIVTAVAFRFDPAASPKLAYADLKRHFGPDATPTPIEVYEAVRGIRRAKGMLLVAGEADCRSAGSFFKNPIIPTATLNHIAQALRMEETAIPHWPAEPGNVKLPAAWLLEQAGFHKGYSMGAAGISSRHTLALINRTGSATFAEIAALRDAIIHEVEQRFLITLEQEPVQLG